MSEKPKEETVQMKEGVVEVKSARNSPKFSKELWRRVRIDFHAGNYTSLRELAARHHMSHSRLRAKISQEKWNDSKSALEYKVEQAMEKKVVQEVDQATSYLASTFKRALKLEKIVDASLSQASLTNEGIPLVDLDSIDTLTRSEARIHDMAKSALRIAPLSQLDITSGGKNLGDSFASAIIKLRDSSLPKLGEEDLKRVLEAEIEE